MHLYHPLLPNHFGNIQFSFDENIDFCIWAAQQTGTQIEPFNYHPKSNNSLNHQNFRKWLDSIVISHDPRWWLRVENIDDKVENQIKQQQTAIEALRSTGHQSPDINWNELRQLFIKQAQWNQKQYQDVVAQYGQQNNDIPPKMWKYDQHNKNVLIELWNEYLSVPRNNPNIENFKIASIEDKERESIKIIHFVTYPQIVEYNVDRISSVVGIPENGYIDIQQIMQNY